MRLLQASIAIGIAAFAAVASGSVPPPAFQALNLLSNIDTVPSRDQIDFAYGGSPTDALQSLVELSANSGADPGIRLRAVYALAKYCGDAETSTPCASTDLAHQSLTSLIATTSGAASGTPVLLLRAAVETIGPMRVSSDVSLLIPLLGHGSRDIRASTARALQDLCNTQAITPLRQRYALESTEQVKLAISEALRILGQCSSNQ